MSQSFLDQVRKLQNGLSHREFAASLGLSESFWSRVRRGESGLGLKTQLRILKRHPELIGYIGRDAEDAA